MPCNCRDKKSADARNAERQARVAERRVQIEKAQAARIERAKTSTRR